MVEGVIGALHRTVLGNIGANEGTYPDTLHFLAESHRLKLGFFRPALDGDKAVLDIHANGDLLTVFGNCFAKECLILYRSGAEDHAIHTHCEVAVNDFHRTNAAANLYKKSEGKIQLLALNTLGVLYLLDTTGEVKSLTDLKGKTVYLPGAGSNPEFITAALLEAADLKVGEDVTLDTTSYNSPDALQAAIIAGKAAIAVLPEPKVSVVTSQAKNATVALDLTAEWEKINGKNTLVQGCLVVNKKFAEEHPAELAQFLKDYEASVNFIKNGSDEAVNMIVDAGILPKAPIAKKALPKCNLCFIAGEDMKPVMTVFCQKMNAVNKKAVAAVPDDGFYYVAK